MPPYSGSGNNAGGGGSNGSDSEAEQVKSLMELQQHQYGLYRNSYGGIPQPGDSPGGFNPRGHLGGYPFPAMQNSYAGYHHLGYPGSASPGGDGKGSYNYFIHVDEHT